VSGIDHDYRLVSALLRNVESNDGGSFLEDAILRIDYVGLKVAFQLSKPFSETIARHALTEMADVVAHFAMRLVSVRWPPMDRAPNRYN
jgi:hypothetical protein